MKKLRKEEVISDDVLCQVFSDFEKDDKEKKRKKKYLNKIIYINYGNIFNKEKQNLNFLLDYSNILKKYDESLNIFDSVNSDKKSKSQSNGINQPKESDIVKRNNKKNDIFIINKVKNKSKIEKVNCKEIPFIKDIISDDQKKLTLEPGNYTEKEILENIEEDLNNKDEIIPKENNRKSNYMNKKLSRSISKESKNKKKKIISILKDDFSLENLKNAIIQMRKELNLEFNTNQEKENFIRKNLKFLEEINNKDSKILCSVLSEQFNISFEKTKILIEYEIFRIGLENKYSNISKFFNRLCELLKNYGIGKISNINQLNEYIEYDPEIGKFMDHIIENMIDYRDKLNIYMEKHLNDINKIEEELKIFFPNFKEKMNDYATKIEMKIKEYEKKFKNNISKELIISYIKFKKNINDFSFGLFNGNNFEKKESENEKNININNNIVSCKIILNGCKEEEKSVDTKKSD